MAGFYLYLAATHSSLGRDRGSCYDYGKQTTMRALVADLVKEFKKEVDETCALARQGKQGSTWATLRKKWPLPGAPRFTKKGAAHPTEVQNMILVIQSHYEDRLRELARGSTVDQPAFEMAHSLLHAQLTEVAELEFQTYKRANRDPPSLGAMFAEVATQKSADYGDVASKSSVMTCASCGAPRSEDSLYGNCQFCGQPLFGSGKK